MSSKLTNKKFWIGGITAFFAIDYSVQLAYRAWSNRPETTGDIQRTIFPKLEGLKEKFKNINFDFYNLDGIKWKGLAFSTTDDYWVDEVGYKISPSKFSQIIETTHLLHGMCLEATDLAINDDHILQNVFDIPADMIPIIRQSWKNKQQDLLSRYDFLLGMDGQLYFLEVNGDTPSGIIEAGPAQRVWAEFHNKPQFNTLEKNIREGFKRLLKSHKTQNLQMFFNQNKEDECTFQFLKSLVNENNSITSYPIEQITDRLREAMNDKKKALFWKQYPFEWLASEETREIFSNPQFHQRNNQQLVEPPWKIVMSNKAMSVLLKAMYPNSSNLIDSQMHAFYETSDQLSKQKYSREGEDIIHSRDMDHTQFLQSSFIGYVNMPIFQTFMKSETHRNRFLTVSGWVINGQVSGVLVREDLNKIIGTGSSVAPCFIDMVEGSDITINLESSERQRELRDLLYTDNNKQNIDTNNLMIQIRQRVVSMPAPQSVEQVKEILMKQCDFVYEQSEKILQTTDEDLSEDILARKYSPLLIGFAPLLSQSYSRKDEGNNSPNTYRRGCGGSGGNYYSSQQSEYAKSNPTPKQTGHTGKVYSSHS